MGRTRGARPSTTAEENKTALKKATAEPQLCENAESSHREREQSFSLCPSANGSNQKRDLQKTGLKIAAAKIFALLFDTIREASAVKLLLCKDYWTPNENGI